MLKYGSVAFKAQAPLFLLYGNRTSLVSQLNSIDQFSMSEHGAAPPRGGSSAGASNAGNARETAVGATVETVPEERTDAISAVPDSESEQAFGPQDAPSTASTQAPGDPVPRSPHGRARNPLRHRWPPCSCPCANTPGGQLGPREPDGQRCACPLCGHSPRDRGHGCHFRVAVVQRVQGRILCEHCERFCLEVLRWADGYYDRLEQRRRAGR